MNSIPKRPESPKHFAQDVLARLSKRKNDLLGSSGRRNRTKIVKKILHQMAKARGHKFHPYEFRGRREFLCDFVWLRSQKAHPLRIQYLALVAECEWMFKKKGKIGTSILYDFRKLLPMKANLKLMIYQTPPRATGGSDAKVREMILGSIHGYHDHSPGEHYFLLELQRLRENHRATVFHMEISNLGPAIKFQKLCSVPLE